MNHPCLKRLCRIGGLLLLCACILLCGVNIFSQIQALRYSLAAYDVEDFQKYKGGFSFLAESLYSLYESAHEKDPELLAIHVEAYDGSMFISYTYSDESRGCHETVPMTEEEAACFNSVYGAFGENSYGSLYCVSIHENTVAFRRRTYALTYTVNGKAPDTIAGPLDNNAIFSQRISLHWFHCIVK